MAKRTVVSSAQYHNFDEDPIFKGYYIGEQAGVNTDTGENTIIGFNFSDQDGEEFLITNAWSIDKALNTVDEKTNCMVRDSGLLIEIEFLGKIENSKGRGFNRFKVSVID